MAAYSATIAWQRGGERFTDKRYSRGHTWTFDGGIVVPASASPHSVPPPYSKSDAVDPEEAFVASLSSCHMLWFLAIAAERHFCVDSYVDEAVGVMAKNATGKVSMTSVTLHPRVAFNGDPSPTNAEIDEMHHRAHAECFIANSVITDVRCEPAYPERS